MPGSHKNCFRYIGPQQADHDTPQISQSTQCLNTDVRISNQVPRRRLLVPPTPECRLLTLFVRQVVTVQPDETAVLAVVFPGRRSVVVKWL